MTSNLDSTLIGDGREGETLALVVPKERATKAVFSFVVPRKVDRRLKMSKADGLASRNWMENH